MARQATARPLTSSPFRGISRRATMILTHAILIALGFAYMFPFLWVLGGSFKTPGEFFSSGLSLLPKQFLWDNYVYAWNVGNLGTYFLNTIFVTVLTTSL